MRLGWLLSLEKGESWSQRDTEGRRCEEPQGEGHLQVKERGLEQIPPSQPSEKINPANTLILDLQPPELGDNTFLLFNHPTCGTLYSRPEAMRTSYSEVSQTISVLIHRGILPEINVKFIRLWFLQSVSLPLSETWNIFPSPNLSKLPSEDNLSKRIGSNEHN